MLIYDDKLFAEVELFIVCDGVNYETADTVLYDYTESCIFNGKDYYYNVPSVNEVLEKVLDWRLNRGVFEDNEIDILNKRSFWFLRNYKTVVHIMKGIIE